MTADLGELHQALHQELQTGCAAAAIERLRAYRYAAHALGVRPASARRSVSQPSVDRRKTNGLAAKRRD